MSEKGNGKNEDRVMVVVRFDESGRIRIDFVSELGVLKFSYVFLPPLQALQASHLLLTKALQVVVAATQRDKPDLWMP